jgi:hypothetical protein
MSPLAMALLAAHASAPLPEPRLVDAPPAARFDAADPPPIDWRQSHELMLWLGGHAGHLRGEGRGELRSGTPPPAHPPGHGPHMPRERP